MGSFRTMDNSLSLAAYIAPSSILLGVHQVSLITGLCLIKFLHKGI